MSVIIPHKLISQAGLSEEEFLQEIAIIFYKKGNISLGKAAEFARMHKIAFQRLLANRKIALNYDIDDLNQDLKTLKSLDL